MDSRQSPSTTTSQFDSAISFLSNQNAFSYTLPQKIAFLESKGVESSDILRAIKSVASIDLEPSIIDKLQLSHSKSGWLWPILSIIACVSVGSLVYSLTGDDDVSASLESDGTDPDPSHDYNDSMDDVETTDNRLNDDDEYYSKNQYQTNQTALSHHQKLDSILNILETQLKYEDSPSHPPDWAKDLLTIANDILIEVKAIRRGVESSTISNKKKDEVSSLEDVVVTLEGRLTASRRNILSLLEVNKDKLSYEIVKKSCSTLFMYISNIVDYVLPAADKADSANIGNSRYKRISTSNSIYKSTVFPVPGCPDVLIAIGFTWKGNRSSSSDDSPLTGHFEWNDPSLRPTQALLAQSDAKSSQNDLNNDSPSLDDQSLIKLDTKQLLKATLELLQVIKSSDNYSNAIEAINKLISSQQTGRDDHNHSSIETDARLDQETVCEGRNGGVQGSEGNAMKDSDGRVTNDQDADATSLTMTSADVVDEVKEVKVIEDNNHKNDVSSPQILDIPSFNDIFQSVKSSSNATLKKSLD